MKRTWWTLNMIYLNVITVWLFCCKIIWQTRTNWVWASVSKCVQLNLKAAPACSAEPDRPSVWLTSGIRQASPSLLRARWSSSEGSWWPEAQTRVRLGLEVVPCRSRCDGPAKWQHQFFIWTFIFKEAGGSEAPHRPRSGPVVVSVGRFDSDLLQSTKLCCVKVLSHFEHFIPMWCCIHSNVKMFSSVWINVL